MSNCPLFQSNIKYNIHESIQYHFQIKLGINLLSSVNEQNCRQISHSMSQQSLEIDISSLPQKQKIRCLELLAHSNVNFSQKQNKFLAQIKIDNSPNISQSILTQQSQGLSKVSNKPARISYTKTNKQSTKCKSDVKILSEKKQQSTTKKSAENNKTMPSIPKGKKQIFKVIKAGKFPKIQNLYQYIQLYIYPKKMSLESLGETIQHIYEDFWKQTKEVKERQYLPHIIDWFMQYFDSKYKDRTKFQQNLVNFLDSVYYHSHKNVGVNIFCKFLSQQYSSQTLSYFLVLRQLRKQIMNQPNYQRNILVLKQNKYDRKIQQTQVKDLIRAYSQSEENVEEQFQNLTKLMFYDEEKRKNFINMNEMFEYLLESFNKLQTHSCNMDLSYSDNETTLNELLFNSAPRDRDKREKGDLRKDPNQSQNKFIVQLYQKTEDQKEREDLLKKKHVQLKLKQFIDQKLKVICAQVQSDIEEAQNRVDRVFNAIVEGDKTKWVDTLERQPTESELLYVQKIQIRLESMKQEDSFIGSFSKQFFMIPGIREFFVSKFHF